MSDDKHNGDPNGAQAPENERTDAGGPQEAPLEGEIIPPETEYFYGAVDVAAEMRAATEQSLLWRHMTDDERKTVVEGEMVLTVRGKRNLEDWIKVGEAVHYLQQEAGEQAGANVGRLYNAAWRRLATPQLRDLTPPIRTRAVWVWEQREVLRTWWATVRPRDRQKWNYPHSIQTAWQRMHGLMVPNRTDEDHDEEHLPRRSDTSTAVDRRSNRAAMADLLSQTQATLDEVRDVVRQVGGDTPLVYDLSTPEMIYESFDNFRQIYGGVHDDAAVQQFLEVGRETMQDEGLWVPGRDLLNDSDDEVAQYLYQLLGEERVMRIVRKIEALWRAERGLDTEPDLTVRVQELEGLLAAKEREFETLQTMVTAAQAESAEFVRQLQRALVSRRAQPPAPPTESPTRPVMRRGAPEPQPTADPKIIKLRRGN
jgi:hypothetical protein